MRRALLVLNEGAGGGQARGRFERVHQAVAETLDLRVVSGDGWRQEIRRALQDGIDVVIAGGGDGTVHAVANELIGLAEPVALGAIGLGSSNDFHKGRGVRFHGIPLRVNAARAVPSDVVRIRASGNYGTQIHHFVVSASCGVVAHGNARFNRPGRALRWTKRNAPNLAVLQASVSSILRYRPTRLALTVDGEEIDTRCVATLSLLKTPWLAGDLHFDTPVSPVSGRMAVNLCEDVNRAQLVTLMASLRRGHFRSFDHARHWRARRVEVRFEHSELFELDGELIEAEHIHAEVLPRRLPICA